MELIELPILTWILISLVLLNILTLAMLMAIQQIQIRRYERFRVESAEVLTNLTQNIMDINTRLTAAGYPPGRVLPLAPLLRPPS